MNKIIAKEIKSIIDFVQIISNFRINLVTFKRTYYKH